MKREYFLDNLRTFIIFLVVVLHTAMAFMANCPNWWYVINEEKSLIYTIIVVVLDTLMMPIVFYIAGYFYNTSANKYSKSEFILRKAKRLLIPALLGTLFIVPFLTYAYLKSRAIPMPPILGLTYIYNGYQQGHFWFLVILFLFFVLGTFTKELFVNFYKKMKFPALTFLLLNILFFSIVSMSTSPDTWINLKLILFQPVKFIVYFNFFIFGIYNSETTSPFKKSSIIAKIILVLTIAVYFINKGSLRATPANIVIDAIGFNLIAFLSLSQLVILFKNKFNKSSNLGALLNKSSFFVYIIHQIFVLGITLLIVKLNLNLHLKFFIVLTSSYILSNLTALIFSAVSKK